MQAGKPKGRHPAADALLPSKNLEKHCVVFGY